MLSVVQSSCRGSKSFLFPNRPVPFTETLAPRQNRQTVDGTVLFGEDEMRMAECHPDRKYHCKGLCHQCYDRIRYLSDQEGVKKRIAQYAKDHREKWNEWCKKYRDNNPEKTCARHKKYNSENKEKISKRVKIYVGKNKEKISKRQHSYYVSNPEKERTKRLKKYGITSNDFDAMFASQKGLCAICGGDNKGKRLHVDHNHDTGKVRQLLCTACNVGLGSLKDSIDILDKAIAYLRKYNHDKDLSES
jgi:hypothetical protein